MEGHGTHSPSHRQAIRGRISDPQVPAQIGRRTDTVPHQSSDTREHKGSWGKKFGLTLLAGGLILGAVERDAVTATIKSWTGNSDAASSPTNSLQADLGGAPLDKEPAPKPEKYTFVSKAGGVTCKGAAVKVVMQKKSVDGNSPLKAFQRTTHEPWKFMDNEDGQVYAFLDDLSKWKGHDNPKIEDKMPAGTVIYLPTDCKIPVIGGEDMRP